jgi:hypothetical protein
MTFIITYEIIAMRNTYSALPDLKFQTISKQTNDDANTFNAAIHVHTTRPLLKFYAHLKKKICYQLLEPGG